MNKYAKHLMKITNIVLPFYLFVNKPIHMCKAILKCAKGSISSYTHKIKVDACHLFWFNRIDF